MRTQNTGRLIKFRRAKKSLIVSFVVFVALIYAYWLVATNLAIRDFWDPQFAVKAALLREYTKQHPGKPVCVVLGSSKVDYGLRPGVVQDWMDRPGSPQLFNFGMSGSDLFREWICLRRLVADGMKPQSVCIEILPVLLSKTESMFIIYPNLVIRARRDEFAQYERYTSHPEYIRDPWYQSRLNPAYQYGMRTELQNQPLQHLLPVPGVRHWGDPRAFDKWGWRAGDPATIPPETFRIAMENAQSFYGKDLKNFVVSEISNRAMDDMLAFCKAQNINAYLLVMPQPREFNSFYPPGAREAVDAFVDKFKGRGVRVIDARYWIASSKFMDALHLLSPGAEEFTRRLTVEIGPSQ